MNKLKLIRIILAIALTLPIFLLFIDFFHLLPKGTSKLVHLQLAPALLAGTWWAIGVIFLLTLLGGRLYCSIICPAGIIQDFINRLTKRGIPKNKQKRYFKYSKPLNWVRYPILLLTVVTFLAGSSLLVILLDPYSNTGRFMTDLIRPALIPLNNLFVNENGSANALFHSIHSIGFSFIPVLVASLFIITIAIMSILRGRLYCNSLCPVGTLLSLVSKYALFKISINEKACNHCNSCARSCKSECIDSKNEQIDSSRCVSCYNCISVCSQNAIQVKFTVKSLSTKKTTSQIQDQSRRNFLIASATVAATAPVALAQNKLGLPKPTPIMPPGATTRDHFNSKCTACHLCVAGCPVNVLKPTAFEYGLSGIMQPKMSFEQGFCQPNCTHCSQVCPTGALVKLTKEQKHVTQVGIAHFTQTNCVVYQEETDCGACSEHCPTQAVSMVSYKNGLTIPHVSDELCIGCGGCEYICPAATKAIIVQGNRDQKIANSIPKGKAMDNKIDNFGF